MYAPPHAKQAPPEYAPAQAAHTPAEDTLITPDSAPLLRPDVFLTPSGSGTVHVRSSRGTDLIAAPGVAGWLDRLTPFLDGTRTVEQLVEGLDGERRVMVLRILQLIDQHGLLSDRADPGPERRAAAYARLRVLVLGLPHSTAPLADALRLTGLSALTDVADPGAARAAVASGDHDALLLLADGDDQRAVAQLDEACRTHGLWFAAAVRDADSWWLGPELPPGRERATGGWLGAWLRVHGAGGGVKATRQSAPAAGELAAVLLAHRFQQAYLSPPPNPAAGPPASLPSGLPATSPVTPESLTRLDSGALTTTRHLYLPHPAARPAVPESEAAFLAKVDALRARPPVSAEEFSRRAAGAIDQRTGLLAELDEQDLPQFPRHASRALVRDPYAAFADRQVHATGRDFATARLRTAQRALTLYALLALDPRRFVPAAGGPSLWAWSPERGTAHLVPAVVVAAQGRGAARGLGCGATFDEAVAAALRDVRNPTRGRRDLRGPAPDPLIVPLDHDPAATEILPHLLRAVHRDAR
ncbi:hypothetical protein [Streptomyces sp. NPDC048111]|uniref:hypothetical protein n=1 Tax=Streptomyces sp. NPDC048111 TaxID=3365500 RepID=UPI003723D1CF